ncbi:MAG: MarR family transcriptional regulator, partial [Lachnospiraceae bacterium]|nr:MarR family transcriptional regulator [Lachnospiraceae bacterium]
LTGCMHRALSFIASEDGISQDQLAEYISVDKATITRAVYKLEQLGFITREINNKDRRVRILRCTESGDRMMELIREKRAEKRAILFRGIDEDQLDIVAKTLVQMLHNSQDS